MTNICIDYTTIRKNQNFNSRGYNNNNNNNNNNDDDNDDDDNNCE